jgi:Putative beta-barrel porin-2, OmpL-like. bbp2
MYHYRQTGTYARLRTTLAALCLAAILPFSAPAQEKIPGSDTDNRIAELTTLVQKLQARVEDLEARLQPSPKISVAPVPEPEKRVSSLAATPAAPSAPAASPGSTDVLRGTTVNFLLDGYYGYNFNNPIGRVNLLRAYDVTSNAFSLSQAAIVLENPVDLEHGKRFGLRVDLQYGQATETLQGNASNELRPNVWRNLFQAYGTYVAPIGRGLTIDFGKWASPLGIEGNYSKDQMNYSRSYWFDYLPFYHTGARLNYKFNDKIGVNYWIVNGTQQTEPFNNFKDQLVGLNLQPHKTVAWTINYYLGQEHPDVRFFSNQTIPGLPTQQGTSFEPIVNAPKGKLHILDSYVTWQATPKLSFALEGDYVIERLTTSSPPSRVAGGALYARYQFTPSMAIAGRTEYLSDHGGLYTGVTQVLKEGTLTFEQRLADGLLLKEEWRGDFSNQPYFLTNTLGILKKQQNTATIGVVWWFGAKQGIW